MSAAADPHAPVAFCRFEEARQAENGRQIVAFQQQADPSREPVFEEIAGGGMGWGGTDVWWSQAIGLALDDGVTSDEVNRLGAFYADRGMEPKAIITTYTHGSLIAGLARRRYTLRWQESVFTRPLAPDDPIDVAGDLPLPEDLRIWRVEPGNDADRLAAARIMTVGFNPTMQAADGPGAIDPVDYVADMTTRFLLAQPSVHVMIASLGDDPTPVAYGSVSIHDVPAELAGPLGHTRTAGLFGGTTLRGARRRGVQTAMLAERLRIARDAGATLATVDGTPGESTERNARRLGFAFAYQRCEMILPTDGATPAPY